MDIYIYYRVDAQHANALQVKATAMQASLSKQCGVLSALKRRPDEKDGLQTWMEVYLAVPDNFEDALQNAVQAAQLTSLIEGERHIEIFLDVSSCV